MTRTTSEGLLVIESGDPAAAIRQGMATADSVNAAIARYGRAVAEATAAKTASEQVLAVYGSATEILAARDQAVAAATQAIINIGSQAENLNVSGAIADVVASAASANTGLAELNSRLAVNVADPAYGLAGTTDNTAAVQAALDAAAGQRPVLFPRRALGQPYVVTGGDSGAVLLKVAAGQVISGDATRPRLQVKGGTGNYKTVLGGATASTDLSGFVLRDLTIDQNATGNPVADVNTLLVNGTQRFVLFAGVGKNLTIKDVNFTNLDSVNTLYIGGPNMADVRVQDCEFDLVGQSTARHDHSTIYLSCDGMTITGNKFRGVVGGLGATTAIETHGRSQIITANRVDGYQLGANITGVANIGNDGILFAHNILRRVMIGVQLWSYAGTNGGIIDLKVLDNTITIDRDPWAFGGTDHPHGISLAQTSTASIDSLIIRGNTIRYLPFSTALTNDHRNGAGIELVTIDTTLEIRNLDVDDNTVLNAIGPGLRLQMKVRRGRVSRNRWVDPSSTKEASGVVALWRAGMVITNEASRTHENLDVYGNRTYDTRATPVVLAGMATSIAGSLVGCEQWDNRVVASSGAVVAETSETFGKRFSSRAESVPAQPFTLGLYYGGKGAGDALLAAGAGTAHSFHVANARGFDRIGCEVTAAGSAGTVLRLGIYADNGQGTPGALVLDAGTVPADTVGPREMAIARLLSAGLYWLVMAAQGGAPRVRTALSTSVPVSAGAGTLAVATSLAPRFGYIASGVGGALPATFVSGGQTATPGLLVVRAT